MVSPAYMPDPSSPPSGISRPGGLVTPQFLLLALALTLIAITADQFAAPTLYSSSPLWATAAFLLLVWRRGKIPSSSGDPPFERSLSIGRVVLFLAAHTVLILLASSVSGRLHAASGAMTVGGTLIAACKLSVLAPTMILFPRATWRKIANVYFPEAIAGLVVLLTFFPRRALGTFWPWYGQALGRFVYTLARIFVPGLVYLTNSNPTLSGPQLDVNIIPECSGIDGLELFGYLFGLVAFLDWNSIRKERALIAYFAGLMTMLLGNALRITSLVVLGNHGFAEIVSRFHISAGWIFFSIVFLVYLSMSYGWIVGKTPPAVRR